MGGLVFEWDAAKAAANLREHRVAFEEALTVFADPLAAIHDDPDHSDAEVRELIVGTSAKGRLLIVSFTEVVESVRIISARRLTRRERRDYEERKKT
jgi:uncharacterized DUF497 family protein